MQPIIEFQSGAEVIAHYKAVKARIRAQLEFAPPAKNIPQLVFVNTPAPPKLIWDTPRLELIYRGGAVVPRIIQAVCENFKLSQTELLAPIRRKYIINARHIAMFLAKTETNLSFPQVAKKFNRCDHTTIMHAVRRITKLAEADETIHARIETIRNLIQV